MARRGIRASQAPECRRFWSTRSHPLVKLNRPMLSERNGSCAGAERRTMRCQNTASGERQCSCGFMTGPLRGIEGDLAPGPSRGTRAGISRRVRPPDANACAVPARVSEDLVEHSFRREPERVAHVEKRIRPVRIRSDEPAARVRVELATHCVVRIAESPHVCCCLPKHAGREVGCRSGGVWHGCFSTRRFAVVAGAVRPDRSI